MSASLQIHQEALALPLAERQNLVEVLVHSIESETLDESWLAEVRRRLAEVEAGTAKLYPWEEVKRQARARNGLHA